MSSECMEARLFVAWIGIQQGRNLVIGVIIIIVIMEAIMIINTSLPSLSARLPCHLGT